MNEMLPALFEGHWAGMADALGALPVLNNVPHQRFAVFFIDCFKIEHVKPRLLKCVTRMPYSRNITYISEESNINMLLRRNGIRYQSQCRKPIIKRTFSILQDGFCPIAT